MKSKIKIIAGVIVCLFVLNLLVRGIESFDHRPVKSINTVNATLFTESVVVKDHVDEEHYMVLVMGNSHSVFIDGNTFNGHNISRSQLDQCAQIAEQNHFAGYAISEDLRCVVFVH